MFERRTGMICGHGLGPSV